ncbi:hypothetical protein NQ317_014836 [Molorchus minor]|uniref:Uncharacterized protein n=1 Tax=Molorchus minor TaxID=1323400 RepID=A0ABQ9JTI4_9CUCU|nr:hypothetical protein NQ317_014836 [Molorchus minor]
MNRNRRGSASNGDSEGGWRQRTIDFEGQRNRRGGGSRGNASTSNENPNGDSEGGWRQRTIDFEGQRNRRGGGSRGNASTSNENPNVNPNTHRQWRNSRRDDSPLSERGGFAGHSDHGSKQTGPRGRGRGRSIPARNASDSGKKKRRQNFPNGL